MRRGDDTVCHICHRSVCARLRVDPLENSIASGKNAVLRLKNLALCIRGATNSFPMAVRGGVLPTVRAGCCKDLGCFFDYCVLRGCILFSTTSLGACLSSIVVLSKVVRIRYAVLSKAGYYCCAIRKHDDRAQQPQGQTNVAKREPLLSYHEGFWPFLFMHFIVPLPPSERQVQRPERRIKKKKTLQCVLTKKD